MKTGVVLDNVYTMPIKMKSMHTAGWLSVMESQIFCYWVYTLILAWSTASYQVNFYEFITDCTEQHWKAFLCCVLLIRFIIPIIPDPVTNKLLDPSIKIDNVRKGEFANICYWK